MIRRRASSILAAALGLAALLPGWATPALAAELTAEDLAELPHFTDEILSRWQVPGGAVAVITRDRILFSGGFGHLTAGSPEPVTAQTVFAAGSVTKAFTATAVAQLVEADLVDLDEPVRTVLPDFSLYSAYATLHATPRDLLTHQVGLPRHDPVWYRSPASREEIFANLRHLEPAVELRQRFIYNNLMYLVAGHLVERAANTSWEDHVRQRIFTPLGMGRSSCGLPTGDDRLDVASPHALDRDGRPAPIPRYEDWAAGPSSSIASTVEDLGRWLQLHLGRQPSTPVLAPELLRELQTPQVVVPQGSTPAFPVTTYGLGWFVGPYRGRQLVWHTGSIDGFTAWAGFLPHDDLGVVVLTNLGRNRAPEVISRWIMDRALGLPEIDWHSYLLEQESMVRAARAAVIEQARTLRDPDRPPALPLAAYAGLYHHPAYGDLVIELRDGGLVGRFHGLEGAVVHYRDEQFVLEVSGGIFEDLFELRFQVLGDGQVASVAAPLEKGIRPIVFRRRPVAAAGETP